MRTTDVGRGLCKLSSVVNLSTLYIYKNLHHESVQYKNITIVQIQLYDCKRCIVYGYTRVQTIDVSVKISKM